MADTKSTLTIEGVNNGWLLTSSVEELGPFRLIAETATDVEVLAQAWLAAALSPEDE
jgi:hypothetical protein